MFFIYYILNKKTKKSILTQKVVIEEGSGRNRRKGKG